MVKALFKMLKGIGITEIITALLALLGTTTGWHLLDRYVLKSKSRMNKKETTVLLSSLNAISEMDDCMEDVVNNTPVERFLIMSGKDSGKIPNPRSPYFVHVLWQKFKDCTTDHLVTKYDNIRVDSDYISLVIKLIVDGSCKYKVAEMKNQLLKRIYEKENIKYSELYFIKQEKSNVVYYLSIATTKDNESFDTPVHRDVINFNVEKIRQIFHSL